MKDEYFSGGSEKNSRNFEILWGAPKNKKWEKRV